MSKYELSSQDFENIKLAEQVLEKAKKKGGKDWERVKGPIKWVGEKGFNTCVEHLSGKNGITNAKALCGSLKREARRSGVLSPKHMGRLERKKHSRKVRGK